jgi:hypothetical protein
MDYKEQIYWNSRTYGAAVKINKSILRGVFALFCVLTPCTNWMIPFSKKIIKNDLVVRYD